jgi:hypothetical protein
MELRYEEDGRSLFIEVEAGDGLAVYAQTISGWDPPHHGEKISADKKTEILQNVGAALEYMNVKYVICGTT